MREWSDKVRTLESRVTELKHMLGRAKAALQEAKLEEIGVRPGDIVRSKHVSLMNALVRVTKVDPDYNWVSGNPMKVDGTFGASVRHLYEKWSKEPPQ